MPFDCQVCVSEQKIAGANVCHQCDNMVCESCWKSWCDSDVNRNKRWADVPCPFCRTTWSQVRKPAPAAAAAAAPSPASVPEAATIGDTGLEQWFYSDGELEEMGAGVHQVTSRELDREIRRNRRSQNTPGRVALRERRMAARAERLRFIEETERWRRENTDLFRCHGTTNRNVRCTRTCAEGRRYQAHFNQWHPNGFYCSDHTSQRWEGVNAH